MSDALKIEPNSLTITVVGSIFNASNVRNSSARRVKASKVHHKTTKCHIF